MTTGSPIRCPREGHPLLERGFHDMSYLWCATCHGLLLTPQQLSILKTRALLDQERPYSRAKVASAEIHDGTARCVCDGHPLMKTTTHGRAVIDVCSSCGSVWLDGGEIHELLATHRPSSAQRFTSTGDGDFVLLELLGSVVEFVLSLALDA